MSKGTEKSLNVVVVVNLLAFLVSNFSVKNVEIAPTFNLAASK